MSLEIRTFSITVAMIPCQASRCLFPSTHPATNWSSLGHPLSSPLQRYWLRRPGALTAGLRALGTLQLTVVSERLLQPFADERQAMELQAHRPARVREIEMTVNGAVCITARSVLTPQAWASSWQALRGLGRRPLADLLYDDPRVNRGVFEVARLQSPHPLARLGDRFAAIGRNGHRQSYWCRRSVFWRDGHPLLVAECFLPKFWDLISATDNAKV